MGDEKRPVSTPSDYREFLPSVGAHAGDPDPSVLLHATDPATADGTTYAQWGSIAHSLATNADLSPGDRVLVDAAEHEHPLKWLLSPCRRARRWCCAPTSTGRCWTPASQRSG